MADENPDWQKLAEPTDRDELEAEQSRERFADSTERSHRAIDGIVAELRKLLRQVDRW